MPNPHPKHRINDMPPEEAKAARIKGAKKGHETKRQRKTLREELLALLSAGDIQERMSLVLIDKVLSGSKGECIQAYQCIRDTIGERPIEKVETKIETTTINVSIEDDDKPKSE